MTREQDATVDRVIVELSARRSDALTTLELLQGYAQQIDENAPALENPQAVRDYLDFFARMFASTVADCERVAAELTTEGVKLEHLVTLREWATESEAEQRRCLLFRDSWINKPLPDERMRPLLNEISVTTRDQLTAFRHLKTLAANLEDVVTPNPSSESPGKTRGFDRRRLFTRLFKP